MSKSDKQQNIVPLSTLDRIPYFAGDSQSAFILRIMQGFGDWADSVIILFEGTSANSVVQTLSNVLLEIQCKM